MATKASDNTIAVFTFRSIDDMEQNGGSHAWHVDRKRAGECKYIICVRNRKNPDHPPEGPEAHSHAFLIGLVTEIEEIDIGRYLIKFDDFITCDRKIDWPWRDKKYGVLGDFSFSQDEVDHEFGLITGNNKIFPGVRTGDKTKPAADPRYDRFCRICFNTEGWCQPSGDAARMEAGDTYAVTNGFGHEEWLLDFSSLMKPSSSSDELYKYAYLQPIAKFRNKYKEGHMNLFLYTVVTGGKRFAVAVIENAYVPGDDELDYVFSQAIETGLISRMNEQVRSFNNLKLDFVSQSPMDIFNVRFDPRDVKVFDPIKLMPESTPPYRLMRYHPLIWDIASDKPPNPHLTIVPAVPFNAGGTERSEAVRVKSAVMGTTYSPQHVILQNAVYKYLCDIYGEKQVAYEHNYVDITVKTDKGIIFIEIKIKQTVRSCIREAIGQLLEYCHFSEASRAVEMIVIGEKALEEIESKYIQHLNHLYSIPIRYIYWIQETSSLSESI